MNTVLKSCFNASDLSQVVLNKGRIMKATEDSILISYGTLLISATKADSCLLNPQMGDEVLFCQTENEDEAYVLSILRRASPTTEADLNLPSEARLKTRHLTLEVPIIESRSEQVTIKTIKTNVKGNLLTLNFSIFQIAGRILTSVFRSFFSRTKESFLEVEETASLNATRIKLTAKEDLITRSCNLDLKAQDSAKIDGNSIRLG
jgi:hypothetical protein